jgi:hypothetical protein
VALVKRLDSNLAAQNSWDLGSAEEGIVPTPVRAHPCEQDPLPGAIEISRQQMITKLAATAFLDRYLALSESERMNALDYLARVMPLDFPEVRFEEARPR